MHPLPLILALVGAVVLAPALLRALGDGGHTRPNYRGRELAFPFGVLTLAAALLALIPLLLVLGLGLLDDTLGQGSHGGGADSGGGDHATAQRPQRGWRGHGAATLRGELSTGALKAAGSLGLALLAMSYLGLSNGRWLLAAAVLVLATNVFNLLDLRPGRATKAFVLLGAGLAIGSADLHPLWELGLFAAPALVAGVYDLRERVMLGDTGANLLGALAGLWLVLTLSGTGQIVALVLLAGITLYGELRSISALIERTPGLRQLDSLGRPT